jgi:hypothetical protein
MRVREKLGRQQVFTDDQTLRQNAVGVKDGKELLLQHTSVSEAITKDHLMLLVRRWIPEECKLSAPREMAFSKHMLVDEFKRTVGPLFGVDPASMLLVKAQRFQLKDVPSIRNLDWLQLRSGGFTPESTLSVPLVCRHGDIILIKDSKAVESAAAAAAAATAKAAAGGGVGAVAPPPQRMPEVALRFRTPEELALEEKRRADEIAERDRQASAARLEMMTRLDEVRRTLEDPVAAAEAEERRKQREKSKQEMEQARLEAIERQHLRAAQDSRSPPSR